MKQFNVGIPFVASGFCETWPSRSWDPGYLAEILAGKTFACRVSKMNCERTMETECAHFQISLKNFDDWLRGTCHQPNPLADFPRTEYCCYIDYKYMKDMFSDKPDIFSHVRWGSLGLPQFDGSHSTVWIGSEGANTPCHQDTYGFNLVTQIHGRKLWVLFPPEDSKFLYPSRIPYEESSIFSAVNIRNPDLKSFPLLKSSHPVIVTLCPGQTLYVPHHWWHYVCSLDPSISVNVWVPVASDNESRYHEAITRALASSLIRDFTDMDGGADAPGRWLNPTESLTDATMNLEFLRTSLTHLVEDQGSSSDDEKEKSPPTDSEAEKPPDERKSVYLCQLAAALEKYRASRVSSPFELKCLKRQASDKNPSTKWIKKMKLSSDSANPQSNELSEGGEEGVSSDKKLFSIDCCSVDVYLEYMRDLCDQRSCTCQRNSHSQEHEQELTCDNSAITFTAVSDQKQNESSESVEAYTSKCDRVILEPSCSSLSSVSNRDELDSRVLSHQDKSPTVQPAVSSRSKYLTACDNSTASGPGTSAGEEEEEEVGDQPDRITFKDRTGVSIQTLTCTQVAEGFLTSVLQPDIVAAVATRLREHCNRLLRANNRKL